MNNIERLIDTEELMSYLGITSRVTMRHYATIRRYIKDGMPAHRIGLGYKFDLDEVLAWLKEHKKVKIGG